MSLTLPSSLLSHMPFETREEQFSKAYVWALAARAGLNIYEGKCDFGVDISFRRVRDRENPQRYVDMGPEIPLLCQLKASTQCELRGDDIVYDLKAKNYNDLVNSSNSVLILLWLPENIEDWIVYQENCMHLFKRAYYYKIKDLIETSNKYTKTIYIPKTQVLTEEALLQLVDQAQRWVSPS